MLDSRLRGNDGVGSYPRGKDETSYRLLRGGLTPLRRRAALAVLIIVTTITINEIHF
jgi:hypothetical protein